MHMSVTAALRKRHFEKTTVGNHINILQIRWKQSIVDGGQSAGEHGCYFFAAAADCDVDSDNGCCSFFHKGIFLAVSSGFLRWSGGAQSNTIVFSCCGLGF